MSNITLYQAVLDKQNAIMLCVDEDGVIDTDKLELIEGTFHEKAVAHIAVNKTLLHQADALVLQRDNVVAEYDREINRLAGNAARVKANLMAAMQATGTASIKSDDGLLCATLSIDRDESIEIDDGAEFPPALCNDPKPPAPSKTKIKAAILKGEAVAGARIVRHDRLTIK